MFVRKKRNRSGTISVVVVDKGQGGFKEIKRFGVAQSEEEAEFLFEKDSGQDINSPVIMVMTGQNIPMHLHSPTQIYLPTLRW